MDGTVDFDEFVAARAPALLRTAYLLTHDRGRAEDLLQTSLTKAWFAWDRIDTSHEAFVRRVLVNTYASWWRRRWNGEQAVVVLRYYEGLTEAQTAELLGFAVGTVKSQCSKALAKLRIDPALTDGTTPTEEQP